MKGNVNSEATNPNTIRNKLRQSKQGQLSWAT